MCTMYCVIEQGKIGDFPMGKQEKAVAITAAAGLAARSLARLEQAAAVVHASESDRRLQMVSAKDGFRAVIKHGRTLIEIDGDSFAVTQSE